LISQKALYLVSGMFETLLAYLSGTEKWLNLWNTGNALYCPAFVQEAYLAAGNDVARCCDQQYQPRAPHADEYAPQRLSAHTIIMANLRSDGG